MSPPVEQCPMPDWYSFADLTHGKVAYGFRGPENGPVAICLHGISGNSFHFRLQVDDLAAAGFRVLVFDFYGRGHTDGPAVSKGIKYNHDFFVDQTKELLEKLNAWKKLYVIGLSMGGGVAVRFAERYPEMVEKVALIAPAGMSAVVPWTASLLKIPLLGGVFESLAGYNALSKHVGSGFFDPDLSADLVKECKYQIDWCGQHTKNYMHAVFSSVKYFPLNSMGASFEAVKKNGTPVHLIWGVKDTIVPTSSAQQVADAIGGSLSIIEEGGHMVCMEKPKELNKIIIDFFKK